MTGFPRFRESRLPAVPSDKSDAELLAGCQRGDGRAWEELVRRYRRLVYSIPPQCGLRGEQADDVFQRVFTVLVENVGRIRDGESLAAWLITTTRRECWAAKRQSSRSRGFAEGEAEALVEEPADVAASIDAVAREHAVHRALERLGPPCRDLLHALYVEDPTPSYEILSARLGRPIGSLGPTRARCLEKLRKLYEGP